MFGLTTVTPRSVLRTTMQAVRWAKYRPFENQLKRASQFQRDWLMNRVRRCESTRFGKDHGFPSIRTWDDFRKQVPVAGYDYFAPYINAVAAGDVRALVSDQDQLVQFTITTGSTGVPKLNPVTSSWLREYRAVWDLWGTKLFTDHPRYIGTKVLQMTGTWDMGKTVGGYQISMVSALLSRLQSPLIKPFYAIPEPVNNIKRSGGAPIT